MSDADPIPEESVRSGAADARIDRRRYLLASGGGALALALAACSGGSDDGGPEGPTEVARLVTLIELERRAAATLASGARFSSGGEAREFTDLQGDSVAHVAALERLVERADGTPPPEPDVPVAAFVRDPESARVASLTIADRLVRAYLDAIELSGSGERRRELTTLLANIAQRQLVLGGIREASPNLAASRG